MQIIATSHILEFGSTKSHARHGCAKSEFANLQLVQSKEAKECDKRLRTVKVSSKYRATWNALAAQDLY